MSDNEHTDNNVDTSNIEDNRYKRKRSDSESVQDHHQQGGDDEGNDRLHSSSHDNATDGGANTPSNATQKKRKFSDKFSTDSGFYLLSENDDSMVFEIFPNKVGHILGSKGMIIVELGKKSGAKILINQDFPAGQNRQVTISGTKEQIEIAADLIKRIVELGPTAIHENSLKGGEVVTKWIECSQMQVGKVIGTGGANIKEIQSQSGARIQVHQDLPPDVPRKIEIVGTQVAIQTAENMIRKLMNAAGNANVPSAGGGFGHHNNNNNHGGNRPRFGQHNAGGAGGNKPNYNQSPYPGSHPAYGAPAGGYGAPYGAPAAGAGHTSGESQHTMEVQRTFVSRIIGKSAENLQKIQRMSGCRVYVDQNGPENRPCKVNITGIPHNINLAVSLIQEIQAGVHTSEIGRSLPPPIVAGPVAPPAAAPYGNPYGAAPYGSMPPPAYPVDPYHPQPGAPPAGGYGGYGQQPYPNPYASGGYEGYGHPQSYHRPPAAAPAAAPAYGHPAPYTAPPAAAPAAAHTGYGYGAPAAAPVAPPAPAAPAVQPPPKPAPSTEWTEHKTDEGIPYWYNSRTRESQWTRPPGF